MSADFDDPPEEYPNLTDRTTIVTDQTCGMARWWYKEEGGTGIVPAIEPDYFVGGRYIHEDMADAAKGVTIEELVGRALLPVQGSNDQLKLENAYWRAAMCAANVLYIEPEYKAAYTDASIEEEMILAYPEGNLWVAFTPDRVGYRKHDDRPFYREYKSVKIASRGWFEHWPKAIQVHIGLKGWEVETGEKPVGYIVGLVKGQWKEGRLHHPYVYGWVKLDGEGGVSNPANWQADYKYGLTATGTWEYPLGIIEWVKRLGRDVASAQFPVSEPIMCDDRLLGDLLEARASRERLLNLVRESCQTDQKLRVKFFEPCYERCKPVVGAPCVYLAACHNKEVNRDPIGSGLYVPRTPHHEVEILGVEGV